MPPCPGLGPEGGMAEYLVKRCGADITLESGPDTYGGTRNDLVDSITLAQAGLITIEVTRFDLSDARDALDRLEHGKITGRAVRVP